MLFGIASLLLVTAANVFATSILQDRGVPIRPNIKPAPFNTGKAFPCSPPRHSKRHCFVDSHSSPGVDDAPAILNALIECNHGGTIILDKKYHVSSPLDLTFLKHVDVAITGEIHFDDSDVYYWADNSFKYEFQNQSVFWKWGGEDVNIYGDLSKEGSIIDGHGQAYWKEIETNKSVSMDCGHL